MDVSLIYRIVMKVVRFSFNGNSSGKVTLALTLTLTVHYSMGCG